MTLPEDYINEGVYNLGYAGTQLGTPEQKGLARQNLDYAMGQLGMLTGGADIGTGTEGALTPGLDAPFGGATPDGGYNDPFTGTDSAGRTPDDPYYGGVSDVGTADPNNWDYGDVNAYYNVGSNVLGGLFGPIAGAFGDAAFGINPIPGAGNYIPGTDTYIPTYLENFEGAGEKITDLYGIGTGEQRDLLIDQGFLGGKGMFGDPVADPDQQFFETKEEALTWYNNGIPVANWEDPGAAEAVGVANNMLSLQGSSFGSQTEAQAVANYGFGSDEHMAAIQAQLTNFQGAVANLENIPERDFIQLAGLAQKAESNLNSIRNSKVSKARDDDIFNRFTGYTDEQLAVTNQNLDTSIANINKTLETNKELNQEQIEILKDNVYTMTSDKIGLINTQLEGIQDTTSEQYSDLLGQLETVEGDLITQINESYTGQYDTTKEWIDKLSGKVDALGNEQQVRDNTYNKQLANLGDLMTEQKSWTAQQLTDFKTSTATNIDNIKSQLATNKNLSADARKALEDQLYTYMDSQVTTINSELMSISDVNSKQYDDLLSELETVEGDLTEQIDKSYTGPNIGYNPITDDAPDIGAAQAEDLGGVSTTDDDAFDEIGAYEEYDDPSESTGPSESGGSSSSDDGGCFVTTATLQEVDTKDDGKELTTFRDFRDEYLRNKSYGPALIKDYYDTAPDVIAEIDSRQNQKKLYQSIWKEHLQPINRLIEKGDNAEATSKYMLMMEELKEKFLPRKGEG